MTTPSDPSRSERPAHAEKARAAEDALAQATRSVAEDDVARVVGATEVIEARYRVAPSAIRRTLHQGRLLLEMLAAYRRGEYREVPWLAIATGAAALLYFINPLDLMPDALPVLGQLDDALVLAAAFRAVQSELKRFCDFRGYDPRGYFGS